MADGIWRTQVVAGNTFNILFQEEEADCGPCCCAMIVNMIDGSKPTSTSIQSNMPQGAYAKSTRDRSGFKPTIFHQVGLVAPDEYHSSGTYINALGHALAQFGIANTPHGNDGTSLRKAMRSASSARPIIVLVQWHGGGGHWIVIAGSEHHRKGLFGGFRGYTRLTILDPYYGGTTLNGTSSTYVSATREGSHGTGSFAPYWLQVD
ncbi:hypothetical protein DESC_780208 [Desulfosarcina cetonica]|uniref:C39 family peptidase n=1 Tax=Desulfosarcina cetonica TaxID=90730 RepID=UPI0006D0A3C6|nr:C39 family peptidase [Desulfosarcina cetonica]VTR70020.1 hypothetical protein DESC_780208 [Desulfosarcina cetonica]